MKRIYAKPALVRAEISLQSVTAVVKSSVSG